MYFPFFKPQTGGKRSAAQPQTIYSEFPSLHGHALGQITRLINVAAALQRCVVGQQLQRSHARLRQEHRLRLRRGLPPALPRRLPRRRDRPRCGTVCKACKARRENQGGRRHFVA